MFYAYLTTDTQGRIYMKGKSEADRQEDRNMTFPFLEERISRLNGHENARGGRDVKAMSIIN